MFLKSASIFPWGGKNAFAIVSAVLNLETTHEFKKSHQGPTKIQSFYAAKTESL